MTHPYNRNPLVDRHLHSTLMYRPENSLPKRVTFMELKTYRAMQRAQGKMLRQ